ncbi:MAG: acyl dehydratase [Pseudonocardia sp. SCN 72-86]|nr:MAG: acyl dehydratase [Pseudonocardia sp. SCN 72-86]
MIDPELARSVAFAPLTVTVERGRLAFFAKATGQADPVYSDVEAAKAAGHPDLPVPPTFLFGLEMEVPEPFGWLTGLGVDLRHVLHGEQSFTYHSLAHAGDTLTLRSRVTDAYTKKTLDFLVKETEVRRGGEPVAEARTTIVVKR